MKRLAIYIKESIDEDNIFYLIDAYIRNDEKMQADFMNIVSQCIADRTVTEKKLAEYIKGTFLENSLNEFVNFINNDTELSNSPSSIDYIYQLKKIIEYVIGNKSSQNKYIKR